jgi:Cu-Zn family superoxide dismutase
MKKTSISLCLLIAGLALSQTACNPPAGDNSAEKPSDHAESHDHSQEKPSDHAADHSHAAEAPASKEITEAVAHLQPTEGNTAEGTVTFTKVENGIRVNVELTGVTGEPGKRGFHIHEKGDCSAPDGTSAGGHFNPHGADHGGPDSETRHAGDFGNVEVDANGNVSTEFIDTHISLEGEDSIIGRAVILHAGTDDLKSQPTGDAGARAACGVIEVSGKDK